MARGRKREKNTQKLLEQMMSESGLSISQKNKIRESVSETGSLPDSDQTQKNYVTDMNIIERENQRDNLFKSHSNGNRGKKQKQHILRDTPYERDSFEPMPSFYNVEKEKSHLQHKYEKEGAPEAPKPIPKSKPPNDRFEELVEEVEDRKQWLDQMKALGEGKKWEPIIRAQITELVQEMKKIDKERSNNSSHDNNNNILK
eukprot:gb/GECH01009705.1/.p1 GENE.gb/GECH01009705.1/~~gb/GECH01009705.1/.p1  ORF type:complete len:201 (+),score=74.21 gb/GECH01009705.1/:1-603(+)